jgi:nucleotide-binding universal stress UspA family protein
LADACAYAIARGVAFDHASLSSPPVDAILDSAATCHANLIVIAADGDEHRLFPVTGTLGDLLRTSDVPVLVLPVGASSAVTSVRSSTAAR